MRKLNPKNNYQEDLRWIRKRLRANKNRARVLKVVCDVSRLPKRID